jgi:VWFA-related protein
VRKPALLALILAAVLGAQDPVFRSGVSLVRVDAQVSSPAGIVDGLRLEDFLVKDNGQPQTLRYSSQDEDPLDLLLLFDISESMRPSIRRVAAAAHTALSELRKGDRIAVADFNTDSYLMAGFNDHLKEAADTVARVVDLRFGGGTHILAAVNDAAKYFAKNSDPHRRRAILVFTDDEGQFSMREKSVVDRMWQSDVLLCGLIIRSHEQTQFASPLPGPNYEDILGVVEKTGGETVDADDPGHAFREMLRRMRKRYSLYYNPPPGKPGSERKVSVELTAEAKLKYAGAQVLARKGYFLPHP